MIELASVIVALFGVLMGLITWSHQKREQYHAMATLTKEYVSAAQELFADPEIPESVKDFFRRISSQIDDPKLARRLAQNLSTRAVEAPDFFKDLRREQAIKIVKAIILFVVALSYADSSHGWKLREFILSNDMETRAVSTGMAIRSAEPGSGLPQAA